MLLTYHNGFSLKCFYLFSQISVCLETKIRESQGNSYFQINNSAADKGGEVLTCWASVSDWNVMYQLLLCANSTLITFGQLSFLNNDSTSWGRQKQLSYTRGASAEFDMYCWSNYLNGCSFRDLTQNDNAPLVIRSHFLPFFIDLYHRRCWGCRQVHYKCVQPRHSMSHLKTSNLHLNTSKMRSMSVVSTLIPSILAMVQIGTNWSLSIWDIRYKSLERFSLKWQATNPCQLASGYYITTLLQSIFKPLRSIVPWEIKFQLFLQRLA